MAAKGKFKLGIIVKKTKGKLVYNKKLRAYLAAYLNELAKSHVHEDKSRPWSKEKINCKRGIHYYSEMKQGHVSVHGYLRDLYYEEHNELPEHTADHNVAKNVAGVMMRAGVRYGRRFQGSQIGHKFVFSISPESSAKWVAAGVDIDASLRQIVDETLDRYSAAAMDGSRLGYAVGIHHDTAHFHAHVALMGYAENGERLKLSNHSKVRDAQGKETHVDWLKLLTGTANTVLQQFQQRLTKGETRVLQPDSVQLDIQKWIQLTAWDHTKNKNLPATERAEAVAAEILRLKQLPAENLLHQMHETYFDRVERLRQLKAEHRKNPTSQELWEEQRRLREEISEAYQLRRKLVEEDRKLRKMRRLTEAGRRLNRMTMRAMTYPSNQFSPDLYSKDNRKLAMETLRTDILLRASEKERETEQEVYNTFPGTLTIGDLDYADFKNQDLKALRIEMEMAAAHRRIEYTKLIQSKMKEMEFLRAKISENKLNLELFQAARNAERSASLNRYGQIVTKPALLEDMGLSNEPRQIAGGRTEEQTKTPERTAEPEITPVVEGPTPPPPAPAPPQVNRPGQPPEPGRSR